MAASCRDTSPSSTPPPPLAADLPKPSSAVHSLHRSPVTATSSQWLTTIRLACLVAQSPVHSRCARMRSEEHTSELPSLMRISYAVFCLKKKKTTTHRLKQPMKQLNNKLELDTT